MKKENRFLMETKFKEIIGVIGAGTMGAGIAQVAAQSGYRVVLSDTNPQQLQFAQAQIEKSLGRLVEKGKITTEKSNEIVNNLNYTTQLSEHSEASLVIEAIVEKMEYNK